MFSIRTLKVPGGLGLCRLITNPSFVLLRIFMYLNCDIIFSVFNPVDNHPFIATASLLPIEDNESSDQV